MGSLLLRGEKMLDIYLNFDSCMAAFTFSQLKRLCGVQEEFLKTHGLQSLHIVFVVCFTDVEFLLLSPTNSHTLMNTLWSFRAVHCSNVQMFFRSLCLKICSVHYISMALDLILHVDV